MSLFNLSSVKNHPRRSGFDLSSKVAFTAKVGELLPVKWTLTMPGDKFLLKEQHFTRTQPVNTSAYTRVREYYDWFWCPLHLLWRNAPEVIAQIQQNVQHASSFDGSVLLGSNMPCLSADQISQSLDQLQGNRNYFGFDRADLAYKLIQYLRYGNVRTGVGVDGSRNYGTSLDVKDSSYNQNRAYNHALSIFPILAYKKFCQDYFRLTQWQDSAPYLWNIDYYDGKGATTILPEKLTSFASYFKNNTFLIWSIATGIRTCFSVFCPMLNSVILRLLIFPTVQLVRLLLLSKICSRLLILLFLLVPIMFTQKL
jgi:hypothetical protein